jgi:ribosomal protein S1
MNELIKVIGITTIGTFFLIFAWTYLIGEVWSKAKVVLSDMLRFFGWVNKSVRKFSVKSEYEGTINGIIKEYNSNFETPVLPKCKLEWVSANERENVLDKDVAIICLSFNKKDHNLNFYNAILNFVQTGLIVKAKDYLTKSSSNAIDLLTTHIILRNNRKEVLSTFRKKLNDFDSDTRTEFESLIPTNERGLFLNLLLPEFHYYGELLETLPPTSEYHVEANVFLHWFKELATREFDERTNLKFVTKNFKAGVILVAKSDTWEKFGTSAYTKWADYYAAEGYNSVYVIAKGVEGYERATMVSKILTDSRGFDQINTKPRIKCFTADGHSYIVTCYSLRPNRSSIAYLAWESIKSHYNERNVVPAIVDSVQKENIVVSAFGLRFEIPNSLLSEYEILDARKVFSQEDELYLNILELDADKQHIVFSNKGTASDPKHYIETVLQEKKSYPCKVIRVQNNKQGYQTGIKVTTPELPSQIFIPTKKATYSRFLDLSIKYPQNTVVDVLIENYSSLSGDFLGSIEDLSDPWESEKNSKIQPEDIFQVIIKQINEFIIICEIEEGLECILPQREISWEPTECITSNFSIDQQVKVKIVSIDLDTKRIVASIKQLYKTPALEYFDENMGKIVNAEVLEIIPERGLRIKVDGYSKTGLIPWFEIGWGAVGQFQYIYDVGEVIKVLVSEFDAERNIVRFSIKRKFKHEFDEWIKNLKNSELVVGKIIEYFENSVHVEFSQNGLTVQGFIFKSNISNISFITSDEMPTYLPIGKLFQFEIGEVKNQHKSVSLNRKRLLSKWKPEYGESYHASYVKEDHLKGYIYAEHFEGWVSTPEENTPIGSHVEVISVSIASGEYKLV